MSGGPSTSSGVTRAALRLSGQWYGSKANATARPLRNERRDEIVQAAEAEIDSFRTAHRDEGRTELDNLRLVHRSCHERDRVPAGNASHFLYRGATSGDPQAISRA